MSRRVAPWLAIVPWLALGLLVPVRAIAKEEPADTELVKRALSAELAAAQDTQHPMRYRLRKSSPRLATTKEIVETKDGAVARLISINDQSLSEADNIKEQTRLNDLLFDPGKQRHRKQAEQDDLYRVLKVIRALPTAFLYQYAGPGVAPAGRWGESPSGKIEKFSFKPNPAFNPPDLETQALTQMAGELWVDPIQGRVTRLEGHLQQDVDFGWGILGRLNKGGWIVLEQAEVTPRQWRVVHFQMVMTGRLVFRSKSFDTIEDQTNYAALPVGLTYAQAIQILRAAPQNPEQAHR
jgi:hypothetical protein